jgi:phage shock protein PspC (stress-responsive transcriptional regulator)
MDCARCGKQIETDSSFCRFCGAVTGTAAVPRRPLVRRPSLGRIAGVCAGIAEYLDADVTVVRLVWVILSIVPGAFIGGLIVYLAAWIVMPASDRTEAPVMPFGRRRLLRSRADRKIAGVCGGIADYLQVDPTAIRVLWVILAIFPGTIIMGLIAYLVAWFIMPESPAGALAAAPTAA